MIKEHDKIITEQVDKILTEFSVPYLMRKHHMTHKQAEKYMIGKKPTNSWDVRRD
jgi:hypothetical protein